MFEEEERLEDYAPLEERLEDYADCVEEERLENYADCVEEERLEDYGDCVEEERLEDYANCVEKLKSVPKLKWSDLNYKEVVRLWNALSFYMFQYGEVMSVHIVIVWQTLGVTDHGKAR